MKAKKRLRELTMDIDTDKLEKLFDERYRSLGAKPDNDVWVDYCDKYKIIMLRVRVCATPSWCGPRAYGEWLADTLNEGKMRGRICIHNCEVIFHEIICPWLLVPKKFAEKCLVLGGLP